MPTPTLSSHGSLPVVVIGSGISGLACAYRLQQAGIPVLVLERGHRPGGLIASTTQDGFLFELGPQSFLSTEPLLALIEAVGLREQLLHADRRAPRYILLEGRLAAAPIAPPSLISTPLFGAKTKWRLISEMCRHTNPPAEDESIAAFVRRKFGDELLDHLVAPFVSGVYAGDPERLSLRAAFPKIHELESMYGSVIRGGMKSRPPKGTPRSGLCSFREGMESLPRAIAAKLGGAIRFGASVAAIREGASEKTGSFELEVVRNGQSEVMTAGAVIVATPTETAGRILSAISPQFAAQFARIEYAPVAVVSCGYRREQVAHSAEGFGFLVPRSSGLRVLGTVFSSSLFPGRAPEGMVCLTSFAGGATDPALVGLSEQEILQIIGGEVARSLGITGTPVVSHLQRYGRALPQYNLGHSAMVRTLQELVGSVPGLFLAGNYISGPSIGACVDQAYQVAHSARAYIESRQAVTR